MASTEEALPKPLYCDEIDVSLYCGRWVRSNTKHENWEAYMQWFGMSEEKAERETVEPQNYIITAASREEITMVHQLPWRDGAQAEYKLHLDGQYHPVPEALFSSARSSWKFNERASWLHRFDDKGLLAEQKMAVHGKPHVLRYWRSFSSANELKVTIRMYEVNEADGTDLEVISSVKYFDRIPFKEKWIAAAAQFYSGMDVAENLKTCVSWMRKAKSKGADLLVLPENANRDRQYFEGGKPSKAKAFEMSETLDGPFVRGLQDACCELNIWACVGVDLRGPSSPIAYIAQVLIRPDGEIQGVHRKHVLWDYEYTLFEPGNEPYQVFDTELGRLGLLICADGIVPEAARVISLMGAQVLLNSLNSRGPDELRVHIPLRAIENGVWHVASNAVGNPCSDGPLLWPWTGGSEICDPQGVRVVASESEDDMIVGEVRPWESELKQASWTNDLFLQRRPDLYTLLTEPLEGLPCAPMYGPAPDELPFAGPDVVKVAMMQFSFTHTRACTEWMTNRQIAYAARRGAALGVLPTLWCFRRDEISQDPSGAAIYSEHILQVMQKSAKEHKLHLCFTLVEKIPSGNIFYHTAYLLDNSGAVLGTYRKAHVSGCAESAWANPGETLASVCETSLGRIAMMISDEIWIPEVSRCLALAGAEIVLHPADWDRAEAGEMAATERASENRVHLVSVTRLDCAGRLGSQATLAGEYIGGEPIPLMRYPQGVWARHGVEEQVLVDLPRRQAHCKMMGDHLDVLHRRFPDLYRVCTKPADKIFTWRSVTRKRPGDWRDEHRNLRGSSVRRRFTLQMA